ncbi:tRNA (adenosine(37)-N6)-threonylcarbamoyltransferase complex ATPase subunit type 1 TsaE [Bartonella ancashensis]|uniref:tRNA threonylcarbamoyladenosine biosynthesis protein TsaE n=1 Tax=Bartonella ancashensis TaxID=1318743 RepID=A0A0M4LG30_9HYPH|nr:tRNA (adenosine(37)-N6)-threonylcarbamoyltransferase complex ATPase subunit type 1 TsaE [Bartonella ancashensis]ALE03294.1 ATPase YjeE, predicted to have essential role in cell wall biosynthesis [Bartonella ancashensis]
MNFNFFLKSEKETKFFAQDLALALKSGDLITLQGDLGTGKSTLARAIIHTLANDDTLDVPSPTFNLIQNYKLPQIEITHADFYRLSTAEEIYELGLHEIREHNILLIEWPEKGAHLLGPITFSLTLEHHKDGRCLTITSAKHATERLQRSFSIRNFLKIHGRGHVHRYFLANDASARSYECLRDNNHQEILMDAPVMQLTQITDPSYAKKMRLATDIRQFVGINQLIIDNGFTAPKIFAEDLENGFLILEDLGCEGLIDHTGKPIKERYISCSALLATFHQKLWPSSKKFPGFLLQIPNYDHQAMQAELSLLLDWYVPFKKQKGLSVEQRRDFFACWKPYLDMLIEGESTFVMRDYHSPNILWQKHKEGEERIGLIDFQDGLKGPTAYDLVSLAQDARVYISPELEAQIVNTYCHARHHASRPFNEDELRILYALAGTQRASKILGIFIQLHQQYEKSSYLKYLSYVQDYLLRNLTHPALTTLKNFYQEAGLLETGS